MECMNDYNHNLIKKLHNSVKLCQAEFVNKTEVATEGNINVAILCREWENVFLHGIKRRPNKSIFSLKSSIITEMPTSIINQINPFSNQTNPSFWMFVCNFLEAEEIIRYTHSLNKVDSEIGRCKAWLRAAINEQTLEPLLTKVVSNQGQVIAKIYYESNAVLLDAEENTVLPSLAAGLSSILFALELNKEHFNHYIDNNHRSSLDSKSQNNSSSSSSFSRPILLSPSTSGSFEDVEIRETPIKTCENEQTQRPNSKVKNRMISIVPIEDEDDGKSDSSDLYSPFNLLKTGLNLVSKFHFGADDRLSNIQEQENKLLSDGIIECHDSNKRHHSFECGLHECDETEFHDCCLSLQNEFYSSEKVQSSDHSENSSPTSNMASYQTADLVVASATTPVTIRHLSEPCIHHCRCNGLPTSEAIDPHINDNEDLKRIRQQLERVTAENMELKSEMMSLKTEFNERENALKSESMKILRENELLKKRLKTYIIKEEFSSDDCMKSDNSVDSSLKIEQLAQMHADLLELNDQLQRSLVDKDIKLGMLQSKVAKLMYNDEEVGVHVENFGTVYIRIADFYSRGTGSQKHLSYEINISCWPISNMLIKRNDEWITYRRFKEFYKLYTEIVSKYPIMKGTVFPSKWVYKPNEEQLLDRQKRLEMFLRTVVTFLLQLWIKANNTGNRSNSPSYVSVQSLVSQDSLVVESANRTESLNTFDSSAKEEAKNIIIKIIPFLAPLVSS